MQAAGAIPLLADAAATGAAKPWPGGRGHFAVAGTFDGNTVALEFLGPDDTTWIAAGSATSLTSAGGGVFELPPCAIRASVTGEGTSAGLYAVASPLPVA